VEDIKVFHFLNLLITNKKWISYIRNPLFIFINNAENRTDLTTICYKNGGQLRVYLQMVIHINLKLYHQKYFIKFSKKKSQHELNFIPII